MFDTQRRWFVYGMVTVVVVAQHHSTHGHVWWQQQSERSEKRERMDIFFPAVFQYH